MVREFWLLYDFPEQHDAWVAVAQIVAASLSPVLLCPRQPESVGNEPCGLERTPK
jgi:hypothetical protein